MTPLDSYLKALGVLRLLSEQAPAAAVRGCWKNDVFVLDTEWTREEILDFFLNRYAPTPVIAPWNGGSGFYPKDQKSGIDAVCNAESARFASLRNTVLAAKKVLARLEISEKSAERKAELLDACRAELPDEALNWFDCAYVLTEGGPKYPALLGTGGNDGRLDFTNNYLQRVAEVFGLAEGGAVPAASSAFLRSALFGDAVAGLGGAAIGQFSPLAGGGPNTASSFDGQGNVNPWNFILMLEGAMCFAAAATRRLGSITDGRLAFPFCVRPKSVGYGSSADAETGSTRCEMWMPLWERPASYAEIHALFAEGKVQIDGCNRLYGGIQAQDAVDFYRAIAALGIDRGVSAFQRYAFQMRNGLAYFAVALDRVPVVARPEAQALLAPIDSWMQRLRGKAADDNAPASVKRAVRRLDEAVVALATQGVSAAMGLLETLGACDDALGNSVKWAKDNNIHPLSPLSPKWLEYVGQGASACPVEARLAAALASFNTYFGKTSGAFVPLRSHLVPVEIAQWKGREASAEWLKNDSNNLVWRDGKLLDSMIAVMGRRLILSGIKGECALPQGAAISANLADVAQFIDGGVDEAALEAMLRGLCLIDWRKSPELDACRKEFFMKVNPKPDKDEPRQTGTFPPLAYSLMRLCYTPKPRDSDDESASRTLAVDSGSFAAAIPLVPMIFNRAASGDGTAALELAARRLRASGFAPVTPLRWRVEEREAFGIGAGASRRIAAALLFPIHQSSYDALARRALRHGEGTDNLSTSNETEHEITPA